MPMWFSAVIIVHDMIESFFYHFKFSFLCRGHSFAPRLAVFSAAAPTSGLAAGTNAVFLPPLQKILLAGKKKS